MKVKQIRENSTDEIRGLIKEAKREILTIKMKKAVSDGTIQPLKARTLRRDVARMETVIRERENQNND